MRNVVIVGNKDLNPICRDYGEKFAESLGFVFKDYREVHMGSPVTYVIDMMLPTEDFINWVRNNCFHKSNVFFRFVDDCSYTNNAAMNEIRIDFRYSSSLGTKIISPYEYKYMDRYIPTVIPYHYEKEDERPLGGERLDLAVLSGWKDAGYVMRYDLYERLGESPYIVEKPHPGYQKGESKEDYLKTLAKYKLMIVTTDQDFELLKYVECAEAGCCPIGEFPSSLLRLMPSRLKWLHCHTSTKVIQRIPEVLEHWDELAEEYRNFMYRFRFKDWAISKYLELQ